MEEADWVKFSDGVNLVRDFESFDSHLDAYGYFAESSLRSAQVSILRTRGKPKRPAVPRRKKTCGVLRKVTRKCYRQYKSSASPQANLYTNVLRPNNGITIKKPKRSLGFIILME